MEKISSYSDYIISILEEYQVTSIENAPELEQQLVFNEEKTRFILIGFGWQNEVYFHGVIFHIEIKENGIWLHQNNTDFDIMEALISKGIDERHIVLGFVEEILRPTYSNDVLA